MGFESRAISARVTKQIVTIFSKTCDKKNYLCFFSALICTRKNNNIDRGGSRGQY